MPELKEILFFADGAPFEAAALKRAILESDHSQARLWVVDLVAEVSTDATSPSVREAIIDIQRSLIIERKTVLDKLINELCPIPNPRIKCLVIPGNDAALIETIKQRRIDLVMKSADEHSTLGTLFGHNDMRLLRKCPCPLWIIRSNKNRKIDKIVAAIDPIKTSQALNDSILTFAHAMAELEQAELEVVHAWQLRIDTSTQQRLGQEYLNELTLSLANERETALMNVIDQHEAEINQAHLVRGEPEAVIPQFVAHHNVDLLVMGTVARSGIPGFFIGNTAERILNSVECSVLTMKPENF